MHYLIWSFNWWGIYFYYPNFIDKSCRLRVKYIDLKLVSRSCQGSCSRHRAPLLTCPGSGIAMNLRDFINVSSYCLTERLQHTSCHAFDLKRKSFFKKKTLRLQLELSPFHLLVHLSDLKNQLSGIHWLKCTSQWLWFWEKLIMLLKSGHAR